jgi:hypothetical protein
MNVIYECEVVEELDTGWCPCCHRYREIFVALVPNLARPDDLIEACAKCLQLAAEEACFGTSPETI